MHSSAVWLFDTLQIVSSQYSKWILKLLAALLYLKHEKFYIALNMKSSTLLKSS